MPGLSRHTAIFSRTGKQTVCAATISIDIIVTGLLSQSFVRDMKNSQAVIELLGVICSRISAATVYYLNIQRFRLSLLRPMLKANGKSQTNRVDSARLWPPIEVARAAERSMAAHISARRKHFVALSA